MKTSPEGGQCAVETGKWIVCNNAERFHGKPSTTSVAGEAFPCHETHSQLDGKFFPKGRDCLLALRTSGVNLLELLTEKEVWYNGGKHLAHLPPSGALGSLVGRSRCFLVGVPLTCESHLARSCESQCAPYTIRSN